MMTKKQAIVELSKTGELTTKMLKPLNIDLDSFLQFAQLSKKASTTVIKKLLAHLSKG